MLATIVCAMVLVCPSLAAPTVCKDPPLKELEDRWREERPLHESFLQALLFRQNEVRLEDIDQCNPGYSDQVLQTPIGINERKCPYTEGDADSIHRYRLKVNGTLTLCPSHSVINYDSRRVPSMMQEVKCSCQDCAIRVEEKHPGSHSSTHSQECIPVKYYARALRRTSKCKNGTFVWEPVWEPLTLACECGLYARQAKKATRVHTESGDHFPRDVDTGPEIGPDSSMCDPWKS